MFGLATQYARNEQALSPSYQPKIFADLGLPEGVGLWKSLELEAKRYFETMNIVIVIPPKTIIVTISL